jgi:hypothetical protein
VPAHRQALRSTGSARHARSPASSLLWLTPTPEPRPAGLLVVGKLYHQSVRTFASVGHRTLRPRTWRIRVRLLRCRSRSDGRSRVSQVPGQPQCQHALLCDPGGCNAPGNLARPYCLPQPQQRRLPHNGYYVAQSHGLLTHCLRFNPCPLPCKRQDSLPAGCQPLPGGVRTHWVALCNFRSLRSFPNIQAYPGALRPNPSLERTSTGKALGPRCGVVHHPPRGPSAFPVPAAQLKR